MYINKLGSRSYSYIHSKSFHICIIHLVLKRCYFEAVLSKRRLDSLGVNMDNDLTLGFCDDMSVKYANVVVGGKAMTMVVRISGGCRFSIEAPMIIFTNINSNYPIYRLDDLISRVSYYTSPKGWMDQSLFSQYFMEL